ncbi:MAG: serine hydrolase, partial [Candidatus Velthaea sp.]
MNEAAIASRENRSMTHSMTRRIGWLFGAGVLFAAIPASAVFVPNALGERVAAGLVAHNVCSATFVGGLDPQATFEEQIRTILPGLAWKPLAYRVDRVNRTVAASFARLDRARARFTPGYGCRLDYPENVRAPAPRSLTPVVADAFAPAGPVETADSKIAAALSRVFTERPSQPTKDVKAAVVVRNGRVVAERYAPGFGTNTPLLSYSVAKSFTNALLGVLVRQGRLRVDQPVGAPEWAATGDVRRRITIEDLARMRSGLDVAEEESVSSPVAVMEYARADMAGFAARHSLKHPPGTAWEYTSANTLILDRLLGRTVGGGAAGMRDFAERELFAPLHIANVTMEFDGAGVFVGSSYV